MCIIWKSHSHWSYHTTSCREREDVGRTLELLPGYCCSLYNNCESKIRVFSVDGDTLIMMPIAVDQRSLIVSVYTTVWRSKHNQTSELEWACWWARQLSWFPYYRLLEFLDYNLDRSQAPTQLSINCLQYKRWKILGGRLGETLLLDDGAMTVHNGGRTRQGDYQYSSCLWPKKSVYIWPTTTVMSKSRHYFKTAGSI